MLDRTDYEEEEIKEWYSGFMTDCPTGRMERRKTIETMYAMVIPPDNAKSFVDQIFKVFDEDGDGTIDFKVQ